MTSFKHAPVAIAAIAVTLAACAPTTPPMASVTPPAPVPMTVTADVLKPNEHLRAEDIPAVPKALADRIGKYTDFKAVNVVAWHPAKRTMLVAYRRGATTQ